MKRLLTGLALGTLCGCLQAPEIVVVDRATVLEEQAGGSFQEIELKLARAGLAPRPVPMSPAQLEALGIVTPPLVDKTELTDADRVDALLTQHCVGEGRDGLLADTREACRGAADRQSALLLVERVNRARSQLWAWMASVRSGASVAELRSAWQRIHARGVVCGGWRQRDDGVWEEKKC